MKKLLPIMLLAVLTASCSAQKKQPVPGEMKLLFPTAKEATFAKGLYTLLSDNGRVVGYAAFSKPASDGIKGYNGETPLLVAFNAEKQITKVVLLPNQDSPGFVERVQRGGLLEAWDGLTPQQALKKKVDVVSGATYTSNGIINTMNKTLETITK